jgi:hypothetical protein
MADNASDGLTTDQMYRLDAACRMIYRAFGTPYLVGSAGIGGKSSWRDVDVRLMLDDEEFDKVCPTLQRWELLSLAIGDYLRKETGLPVDFQIQRTTEANAKHGGKPRNPLGMRRNFAAGGDATPFRAELEGGNG